MKTLIVSLVLALVVGCATTTPPPEVIPDKVDTFETLIAKAKEVAILQEDGARAKGIFNEERGYIATIVFFTEGDVLWEFELLNWSRDGVLELWGYKDGRLYITFSKVTEYRLDDNGKHWYNLQSTVQYGWIPENDRKDYTDQMIDVLKVLIDSPLSGLDANAATRRFIEEKLKQEEGQNENPRPQPEGSSGSRQIT